MTSTRKHCEAVVETVKSNGSFWRNAAYHSFQMRQYSEIPSSRVDVFLKCSQFFWNSLFFWK